MNHLRQRLGGVLAGCVLAGLPVALSGTSPGALRGPAGGELSAIPPVAVESTCLDCHGEIEPMHPEALLSCVDCHGGDPTAKKKVDAHVRSLAPSANDERVAPQGENLAWRRFRNPMDLRVVQTTCAECHASTVHDLETGMHSTTAGHLSDGYYEMGLVERKRSLYGIFPVASHAAEGGEIESLVQVPA